MPVENQETFIQRHQQLASWKKCCICQEQIDKNVKFVIPQELKILEKMYAMVENNINTVLIIPFPLFFFSCFLGCGLQYSAHVTQTVTIRRLFISHHPHCTKHTHRKPVKLSLSSKKNIWSHQEKMSSANIIHYI